MSDRGDFERLDVERAHGLAAQYAIDFLITEQSLDLPVANATGQFTVCALGDGG